MNVSVQIENEVNNMYVTIFPTVLKELFGDDSIPSFKSDPNSLVQQILSIQQHDFTLSFNTNIVLSVVPHVEKSSNFESNGKICNAVATFENNVDTVCNKRNSSSDSD